jgi:phosphatidylserine decarboxylase
MHSSSDHVKPIHNRIPIAREGVPFIALSGFVVVYLLALGFSIAALVFFLVFGFIVFFFRNPERTVPQEKDVVVSPADGKVVTVEIVDDETNDFHGRLKISVFMSLFNVHVNRIPADGVVTNISYHPGRFLSADLDKASEVNERNTLYLDMGDGREMAVAQVAGLVARRIVCKVHRGDPVKRGDRFGLIRFGSRLDVFLPAETRPAVSVGEKVTAGVSRLGFLK